MKLKNISFMRLESRFGVNDKLPNLADMLRYDVAFQSTVSPEYVAFPVFGTKHGNLGGRITHGRWDSFGVRVKYIEDAAEQVLSQAARTKPEAWVTFRHPRNEYGQLDYSKLAPFTLEAYLSAKDTDSL